MLVSSLKGKSIQKVISLYSSSNEHFHISTIDILKYLVCVKHHCFEDSVKAVNEIRKRENLPPVDSNLTEMDLKKARWSGMKELETVSAVVEKVSRLRQVPLKKRSGYDKDKGISEKLRRLEAMFYVNFS